MLTCPLGLLIYIPGFSKEGVLLALAGGSNETFVRTYDPWSITKANKYDRHK
jgi:hypothetical protein